MTAPLRVLSALGKAALAYAHEFRWQVIPLHAPMAQGGCSCGNAACPSPAKHPRTPHGLSDASADPAAIAAWWAQWPGANVGLVTGVASGIVIVDLDGPEAEQAFAQQFGNPPTACSLTSRGRHLVFQHPGVPVPNSAGKLGPKIDVRGDGGYVVAPPSVHAKGHRYRWDLANNMGPRECPPIPLPPRLLAALTASASPLKPSTAHTIPTVETIPDGERNSTLAQYAGRLLAKGHTVPEAFELVLALNAAKCRPPLLRDEVWQIVQSIGGREARKPARQTATGVMLTVAQEPAPDPLEPAQLAKGQAAEAEERGRLDLSAAPRWGMKDLHDLVGPLLPGELHVIGALTGNGKTALLMSQMDWAAAHRIPTLYLGLEKDAFEIRRQWAAWKLGFDWRLVHRNEWGKLGEGAQESHETMLHEQAANPYVQFSPDRRVDVRGLGKWVEWGVKTFGCRQVILDHFHRMNFGALAQTFRVDVTEASRALKDLARQHQVALLAAAQLNRMHSADELLDRYFPPSLARLKESAAIGEEADTVVMISRRLRTVVDPDTVKAIRAGHKSIRDFEESGVMMVTCRKHRLDNDALDQGVRLAVVGGKVTDLASGWAVPIREDV